MREPEGAFLRAVGKRIAELRDERGLTQEELSQRLQVSAKQVQKTEQGGENLELRTIERFAAALGVAPAQLLLPPISSKPARAGRPSKRLPPVIRRVAPRPGTKDVVPLYRMIAAAGETARADLAEISEHIVVEGHKVPAGSFVLRVAGDSMTPQVPDGSLVLFAPVNEQPDGKVVLVEVSVDDVVPDYLLKKVSIDWRAHAETGALSAKLVSTNRKYQARTVELSPTSGYRIVAEMVALLSTPG